MMKINFCNKILPVTFFFITGVLLIVSSCAKKGPDPEEIKTKARLTQIEKKKKNVEKLKSEISKVETNKNGTKRINSTASNSGKNPTNLDFEVLNQTGREIYITCFSYIKKRTFGPWRWDKSAVYKLKDKESVIVGLDDMEDEQEKKYVFGYLGVFNSKKEADDSTYELMDDANKLDLDRVIDLKNKKVTINVETYGQKGEFVDFDFVDQASIAKKKKLVGELDFAVENRTGKPILVTCFVYLKKAKAKWLDNLDERDDMEVWHYSKTDIIRIEPEEIKMIDVDTVYEARDRVFARGVLAVFDANEMKEAEASTYQLLDNHRKLVIAELLINMHGKKVVISVEKYGLNNDFIDFTVKPVKKIDFKNVYK